MIIVSAKEVYNSIRLKNIKRAKLRQKEKELELQYKNNASIKDKHQTMKEINKLKTELSKL